MAYFQAILVFGIGSNSGADSSDSNQNEPEPEPHKLVAPKEPKSDSKADSKAGITAALHLMYKPPWLFCPSPGSKFQTGLSLLRKIIHIL